MNSEWKMPDAATITARIRAIKSAQGMKTKDLVRFYNIAIGDDVMTVSTMNGILGGKRSYFKLDEIAAYCILFGIHPLDLLPELGDDRRGKELARERIIRAIDGALFGGERD